MINKFKYLITHPLFSGSAVMVLGSNVTNLLNYAYHLVMGRLLGPGNYGELAVLISLIGLLGIIPLSFNLVIVRFVSAAHSPKEITGFINWLQKRTILLALGILVLITVVSPYLASFLNIENPLLIVMSAVVFLFMVLTVANRAVLQGLLRFKYLTISLISEYGLRLILGAAFVYLGFSVLGVMFGFIGAVIIAWFLSIKFMSDYTQGSVKASTQPNVKSLFLYSVPVLVYTIANTSHDAGIYAALSTLGKIIFFGAGPVAQVMFPIISKRHAQGEDYKKVFLYSLILSLLISLAVVLIYWLFPSLSVTILFGSSYLEVAGLLVQFGLFMTLLTLSSLMVNFYLSIGQTKVVVLPFVAALAQIIGLWFYHSSLEIVVNVSLVVSIALFAGLFVYFFSFREQAGLKKSPQR